jgi:tripartite-type tricarboxylate transporter receptor subunit TctC
MKGRIVALALVTLAGIACAQAQTYPSRQITLIVPFPPGGSTDVAARIMAERMRAPLGQPVIIENVGGAGGSIAVGRVARAAPDGYTIDIGQWDTHVGSIIYKLDYDLQKDFEPIGLISNNPQLMVAKKDLPADNLKDLVAWMKANPGKINFVNQNAAANVSGVLFEKLTGQKIHLIPYRGAGPAMTDLVSGQVDLLVVQGAVALPQIRGGKIKALANLSPQRSAAMPDIPDLGRRRRARALHVGLVRFLRAERHAERHHRHAQQGDGRSARRSGGESALHGAWARRRRARAADTRRSRRLPEGRDRQVVADHQGSRRHRAVTHSLASARQDLVFSLRREGIELLQSLSEAAAALRRCRVGRGRVGRARSGALLRRDSDRAVAVCPASPADSAAAGSAAGPAAGSAAGRFGPRNWTALQSHLASDIV